MNSEKYVSELGNHNCMREALKQRNRSRSELVIGKEPADRAIEPFFDYCIRTWLNSKIVLHRAGTMKVRLHHDSMISAPKSTLFGQVKLYNTPC